MGWRGLNYYEHHLGDWAAATGHLTWDEDMAYTRLLRAYYHHERAIPEGQQYRLAKAATAAQRKAVDQVLAEFFELRDGLHHQKRADAEVERYQDKQRKAKASANARWSQSERNANASPDAMRTHSDGNALQTPDTRHQTPNTEPPPLRGSPPAVAGRRPSRKAPADFSLAPELVAWAAENTPLVNAAAELEKFKDHTFSAARTDWPGTLRNWLRKAQEDAQASCNRVRRTLVATNDEPEWRRLQRERNEAALGPYAAKRKPAAETIDMEPPHGTASLLG